MLIVRVELWPGGDPSRRKTLATGKITNTGEGSPTSGEYRAVLLDGAGREWKTAYVAAFPRKRLLAWDLLYRVLRAAVSHRNS